MDAHLAESDLQAEEMFPHGIDSSQVVGDFCPCDCYVCPGTESAQGSVCHFVVAVNIPDF